MKLIEHFIDGKNYSGDSKRKGKVFNPATGEQSAEVTLATRSDTNKAIENAKKFSSEDSTSFVNGVLDSIYKEL